MNDGDRGELRAIVRSLERAIVDLRTLAESQDATFANVSPGLQQGVAAQDLLDAAEGLREAAMKIEDSISEHVADWLVPRPEK